MVDRSMVKLMSKSNFSLLSSFQVKSERVVNGFGSQKSYQNSVYTWSKEIQCENRKIFTRGLTGVNYVYFLGPKSKNCYLQWDNPSCTPSLVKIRGGFYVDHKSLNRIELS